MIVWSSKCCSINFDTGCNFNRNRSLLG